MSTNEDKKEINESSKEVQTTVEDTSLDEPVDPTEIAKKEQNKSIVNQLSALFKNMSMGSDLTTIQLSSSFQMPISALQLMRDSMFKPFHYLIEVNTTTDPIDRMLLVVRYIISCINISEFGKKPLNPILGELQYVKTKNADGSESRAIGEQVSHHPPITALKMMNEEHGLDAEQVMTQKASFWGKHVHIELGGSRRYTFKKLNETYVVEGWPGIYARIFRLAIELVGKFFLRCAETGYVAQIKFKPKPLLVGKWNEIEGFVYHTSDPKTQVAKFSGYWSGMVNYVNLKTKKTFEGDRSKRIWSELDINKEEEHTSERVWKDFSENLLAGNTKAADKAKQQVEEAQREKAKLRQKDKVVWIPKHFVKDEKQVFTFNNKE